MSENWKERHKEHPFQCEVFLIKAHRFLKLLEGKLFERIDLSPVVSLRVRHDQTDPGGLARAAIIIGSAQRR